MAVVVERREDQRQHGRIPAAQPNSEAGELALTFNEMLSRLQDERRDSTGRVLRAQEGERLRIAQELHDVLAHNISLINVQAGVALHVNEQLPDHARAALTAIKQASREALGELRTVLDVLRQNGDAAAPRRPAPGLAQLQDLVEGAKVAGLETHVEIEGEPVALPAPVDLAAYRIAQEALTNVIRHAGAANVWVRVLYGPQELGIRVEDDGSGPLAPQGSALGGGGNGIPGMRERAAALGGRLDTGPRPGGGFQVLARLPLGPTPEAAPRRAPSPPALQPGRADEPGERGG